MPEERVRGLHGWDGPVEIVLPGTVRWERDAKTLAALIQDSAPVESGTLKRDLSLRRAGYKRLPAPRAGWRLCVHNAYALIQDVGGQVPERRPTGTVNLGLIFPRRAGGDTSDVEGDTAGPPHRIRWLRWGQEGAYVFARRAGPFTLPGQNYLDRGIGRWMKSRGHGGLEIEWVPAYGEAA